MTSMIEDERPAASAPGVEHVAASLGLRSLLLDARQPERTSPIQARVRAMERIGLARVVVAATGAEIACEEERASQAAEYLGERQHRLVNVLTVSSVIVGSLATVASAALQTADAPGSAQLSVAVVGAAATAALGIGALTITVRMPFSHPRNPLADLWNAPERSSVYPPLIWAYLGRPQRAGDPSSSIRGQMVARWRSYGVVTDASAPLLFGTGGTYDADQLRVRAALLDQVDAEVQRINQELAELSVALLEGSADGRR